MCHLAKINNKTMIYDLGCGTGHALSIASREFGAQGVGIEIDPFRVWIAKQHIKREGVAGSVKILKENFFHVDLSPAHVVFLYLIPPAIIRLSTKLTHELKSGTILVSYKYEMPVEFFSKRLVEVQKDKKHELYVYKMKK